MFIVDVTRELIIFDLYLHQFLLHLQAIRSTTSLGAVDGAYINQCNSNTDSNALISLPNESNTDIVETHESHISDLISEAGLMAEWESFVNEVLREIIDIQSQFQINLDRTEVRIYC